MGVPGDRRARISAAVRDRGSVRVADLAAELGVAAVTLRRDVELMAKAGELRRSHGLVHPPGGHDVDGVVTMVAQSRDAYIGEIVSGARAAAAEQGVEFVLDIATDLDGGRAAVARAAARDDTAGVLYVPRWKRSADEQAEAAEPGDWDVPVVLVERFAPRGTPMARWDAVRSDHAHGVDLAVGHLQALGHTRVLLAARADSPTARTIRAELPSCLRRRGLPVLAPPLLSAAVGVGDDPAERMPSLVEAVREHGATAMVVHSDVDALPLLQHLQDHGLDVPRDLSVVAYDDIIAGMGGVELTAVAPPKREVGQEALALLFTADTSRAARHLELLPALVERGTTRPL